MFHLIYATLRDLNLSDDFQKFALIIPILKNNFQKVLKNKILLLIPYQSMICFIVQWYHSLWCFLLLGDTTFN